MRGIWIGTVMWAAAAGATPYDGSYLPEDYANGARSCAEAGTPGGITSISGDTIVTTLYGCRLANPVEVRGMEATLYDAVCGSDSEQGGGRLMLTRLDDRLLLNWGHNMEVWLKCR